MEDIIKIENLRKSFGDVEAVKSLGFRVKKGELFAFLGSNGAGKSTTINIVCGQLRKDGGKVEINGGSLDDGAEKIKRCLGVVFQSSGLDSALSVYDNLKCRAALYGVVGREFQERYEELSTLLDFKNLSKRAVGKLSGGQRRRIDVARALFHKPQILVLDEPTTGLDPQTRRNLWKVISDLRKQENLTVFLTTHYMEEAAEADRIVIIDEGRIVAEGTPIELKNRYVGDYVSLYGATEEDAKRLGFPYEKIGDAFRISVPDIKTATKLIVENGETFVDYEVTKGKMDDVFLAVTGKKLGGHENENALGAR